MDSINQKILKTSLEAIPQLTKDNFSIWRTQIHLLFNLAKIKDLMLLNRDLPPEDSSTLTTIIISKLSPAVHSNIITSKNEENSQAIWKALLKHFILSKPANQARFFKSFTSINFGKSNIQLFITKIKSGITQLQEIGIQLPTDILAYMILEKLPSTPAFKSIQKSITNSAVESKITPNTVLHHLCIHLNK